MSSRLAPAALVIACLCSPTEALRAKAGTTISEQAASLTRQQRDLLQTLIAAVDAAASTPETANVAFHAHLMRASDGSHYLAWSIEPPSPAALPKRPAVYVRLATATASRPERSPIREWLTTNQNTPPPSTMATRGIVLGEMPIMGAAGGLGFARAMSPEVANLAAIDLERRRARERQQAQDRQRRAELEGRATVASEMLPFEDFDFNATPVNRRIERALTTGPGEFVLYVAFADADAPKSAPVTVIKKTLALPPASTELTVSSVILADSIQPRPKPYPPSEQSSHPYSIGPTEIVPAADAVYRDSENLGVVFQVINAKPNDSGKPNVDITFEIVRFDSGREQSIATLTPQNYSDATLPADFDLRVGHPLFASVSAPLATLKRGSYRLKILINDKVAGVVTAAGTDFTVAATNAALLREAPPLGAPFNRDAVFAKDVLSGLLTALRPASPSPALQRAFDLAATGKFVELMVEEPVSAAEEGARSALRGLAHLSVGDGSAAAVQFQRAQLLGAPVATTRFLSGAARAHQSRDADAIAAWQDALTAGASRALIVPHLIEAYLRRNDIARASALLADLKAPGWSRSAAAVLIATNKESDAIPVIEAHLAQMPADVDAQWLLLHALFARCVHDPNAAPSVRDRLVKVAQTYIDAKGMHAALAEEWMKAISSS